jgi:hypothetical protein
MCVCVLTSDAIGLSINMVHSTLHYVTVRYDKLQYSVLLYSALLYVLYANLRTTLATIVYKIP